MYRFSRGYLLILGAIFFVFAGMISYFQVSSKFMQTVYLIDEVIAGRLYSLPYYMLVVSAPCIGYYNSRYGNRIYIGK